MRFLKRDDSRIRGVQKIVRDSLYRNIFTQHEHDIMPWCRAKGYANDSMADSLMDYFQKLTGQTGLSLADQIDYRMNQLGFTNGTLNDKLNAFFETKFPYQNRGDSEGAFWDQGGDFSINNNNISMFFVRDNAAAKSNDTDYFQPLMGVSSDESTNIQTSYFVMPTSGTFKRFRVKWDQALTGAQAIEYSLVVNGTPIALATVDSSGSTKTNDNISINVVKGDLVAYKVVVRNSPTMTHYWLNIELENSSDMVLLGSNKALWSSETHYSTLQTAKGALLSTNIDGASYFPTDGHLSTLYVRLSVAPGAGNSRRIRLYKTDFTGIGSVLISDTNTTAEVDLGRDVVAGEGYWLSCTAETGTPTPCYMCHGIVFTPTVKGEYPVMYSEYGTPSNTEANWNYIIGPKFYVQAGSVPPASSERKCPLRSGFTIKKWFAKAPAPGAGKSVTMDLVKADTTSIGLTATIADANTTASDSVNTYTTVEGEEYGLRHTPTGTPNVTGRTYASFVLKK